MSALGVALLLAACAGVLALPRRAALVALLLGVTWIPLGEPFVLGPFNFYAVRVLIAAALLRLPLHGERAGSGCHRLDVAMAAWCAVALVTALAHKDPVAALVNRLGLVYTAGGTYLVLRVLVRDLDDVEHLCRAALWVLVPVGLEMLFEAVAGRNLFALLGGVPEAPEMRDGRLRAQGPFTHAILAGTVGAACLPLAAAMWRRGAASSLLFAGACVAMMVCSGSSGPLMSGFVALGGLALWPWRERAPALRWGLALAYVALELAMNAPAYYVLAHIDLTGSSTSWHRAFLIETAFSHLDEWWLAGTDYTRHWMAYGVLWTPEHIDITNYYLRMGVDGGLPLMVAFIALLACGFSLAGRGWRRIDACAPERARRFLPWALGVSLLAHAASFISVSYFDQSLLFFVLTLGAIAGVAVPRQARAPRRARRARHEPFDGLGPLGPAARR